jgi:AcrR family transcriptional regulator
MNAPTETTHTTPKTADSRGDRTRAAILEAAYDLFVQAGYHGTSMRQIAERANIGLSSIYNHFYGKEMIFAALLDAHHPFRRLLPALEAAEGETIEEFVHDGARRAREAVVGSKMRLLPLIFIELLEFQGQHLAEITQAHLPELTAFTEEFGRRHGRLRRVPEMLMVRSFIGLIMGLRFADMTLNCASPAPEADFDWFEGMVDIYLHGIVEADPAVPAETP